MTDIELLNEQGWNELNRLKTVTGGRSELSDAIDDFVNSIPDSALTPEEEVFIENAAAEIAALNNELGAESSDSSIDIPYDTADASCFPSKSIYESPDGKQVAYLPGFTPSNSATFSALWENFSGIRLWWKIFGSLPSSETESGYYYFIDGKQVSKFPENFLPPKLKWSIESRERITGRVVTKLSIADTWTEVLPLFSLRYSSSTSLTIASGSQTLYIDLNLDLFIGQIVTISYDDSSYMKGIVSSYNKTNGELIVNVTEILGSGTYTTWIVEFNNPTIVTMTWDKTDGSVPTVHTFNINDLQENLWESIKATVSPNKLTLIPGSIIFTIIDEPVNVNFFETTKLEAIVSGQKVLTTEKWVRPLNQSGIIAVEIEEDTFTEFRAKQLSWTDIRRNLLNAEDLATAGGYLFFGVWLINIEGWSNKSWIPDALEDDRVRQVSTKEGLWENFSFTNWENTRRKWESLVLEGGSVQDLIEWLTANNDDLDLVPPIEVDYESDSETTIEELNDAGLFDEIDSIKALSGAFEKIQKKANSSKVSMGRATKKLSQEMDRTTKAKISQEKLNDLAFQEKVAKVALVATAAIAVAAVGVGMIQSGSLCRIREMSSKLSKDTSVFWKKLDAQFKDRGKRRKTGGRQLVSEIKKSLIKKFESLKKSISAQSNKLSLKLKAMQLKLTKMKSTLKPPSIEFKKCDVGTSKMENKL